MTSLSDTIIAGLAPLPGNRPKKVTFDFAPGQTITLKGTALIAWWTEYSRMYLFFNQMTQQNTPLFSSEQIQEQFDAEDEDDEEE